jgi:hypothetical protein
LLCNAGQEKLKAIGTGTVMDQSARVRPSSFSVDESSGSSSPTSPAPGVSKKTETDFKSENSLIDLSIVKVEQTIWEVPEPTVMLDITGSTTIETVVDELDKAAILSPKRQHNSQSSDCSTETPTKLVVMEEETAISLEGTTESDESQIAQAERKKFPIFFVESEKRKL